MRAAVVPKPLKRDPSAVVTVQVAGEEGNRVFAESKWQLGRYKLADAAATVEFRLPFSLSEDFPVAARTIETRIFAPGNIGFHILSLSVVVKNENFEGDWFPYLTVQNGGIHTGAEIRSTQCEADCVASTPAMPLLPGHYKLAPEILLGSRAHNQAELSFELWSGSEPFAIADVNGKSDLPLEFDVPNEFCGKAIELRISILDAD